MKKSLVAVMLGLMMTVSLVGCGGCGTEVAEEETEAEIVRVEVLDAPTEEVETEVEEEEEPTEVAEEEPTEVVEEVAEEVTEEPAVEETPVEETSPYSYTELNQVMYAQSTVNVRDLPEQTGGKLGSLSTNQEVTVTGQCNETGWYRISYNGGEGFVSNSYLGTEKVAVKSSSSGTASQSSQPQAPAPSVPEAPAPEAPAPSAPEAPAEESDPYAGMTLEEASDSIALTPDVYHCPICGYETTSYDEYVAHMQAEGVQ